MKNVMENVLSKFQLFFDKIFTEICSASACKWDYEERFEKSLPTKETISFPDHAAARIQGLMGRRGSHVYTLAPTKIETTTERTTEATTETTTTPSVTTTSSITSESTSIKPIMANDMVQFSERHGDSNFTNCSSSKKRKK